MSSDLALRREIARLVEDATPAAPWLEHEVMTTVRAHAEAGYRTALRPRRDFNGLGGLGTGLRLAAGLMALLIAVGTVLALLMSSHVLHHPTVPGGRSTTVHAPSPSPPPGGPVPAQLLGDWFLPPAALLALGSYRCPANPTAANCYIRMTLTATTFQTETVAVSGGVGGRGDVVVNNNEIDFFNGVVCGLELPDGVGRYTWTLTGGVLYLTLISDPCPVRSASFTQQGWSRTP